MEWVLSPFLFHQPFYFQHVQSYRAFRRAIFILGDHKSIGRNTGWNRSSGFWLASGWLLNDNYGAFRVLLSSPRNDPLPPSCPPPFHTCLKSVYESLRATDAWLSWHAACLDIPDCPDTQQQQGRKHGVGTARPRVNAAPGKDEPESHKHGDKMTTQRQESMVFANFFANAETRHATEAFYSSLFCLIRRRPEDEQTLKSP